MKKGAQGPARRYARALLDVATAQKVETALATELQQAAAALEGSPELQRALSHPALGAERRKKVVEGVFQGASPLFTRLLDLLVENDRVGLLPELSRRYAALWNEERGVLTAEAVTAVPLGPEQKAALRAFVEAFNAMDGRGRLELDTIRREEIGEAFLQLAAGAGLDEDEAGRWFDGWRDF